MSAPRRAPLHPPHERPRVEGVRLLAMLALVGLDHRFNNYEAQPLSLFALLPLLLSLVLASEEARDKVAEEGVAPSLAALSCRRAP